MFYFRVSVHSSRHFYGGSSRFSGLILATGWPLEDRFDLLFALSDSLALNRFLTNTGNSNPLTLTEQLSIIVCTIAGATLMYYFIEQPFMTSETF